MKKLLLATLLLLPTLTFAGGHNQSIQDQQRKFDRQMVEQFVPKEEQVQRDELTDELIVERLNTLDARTRVLLAQDKRLEQHFTKQVQQLAQVAQILLQQNSRLQEVIICLAETKDEIESICISSKGDSQASK